MHLSIVSSLLLLFLFLLLLLLFQNFILVFLRELVLYINGTTYYQKNMHVSCMFWGTFYLLQRTPLHYAAEYDHGNVVKYLVEQEAQVNCKDKNYVRIVHAPKMGLYVIHKIQLSYFLMSLILTWFCLALFPRLTLLSKT